MLAARVDTWTETRANRPRTVLSSLPPPLPSLWVALSLPSCLSAWSFSKSLRRFRRGAPPAAAADWETTGAQCGTDSPPLPSLTRARHERRRPTGRHDDDARSQKRRRGEGGAHVATRGEWRTVPHWTRDCGVSFFCAGARPAAIHAPVERKGCWHAFHARRIFSPKRYTLAVLLCAHRLHGPLCIASKSLGLGVQARLRSVRQDGALLSRVRSLPARVVPLPGTAASPTRVHDAAAGVGPGSTDSDGHLHPLQPQHPHRRTQQGRDRISHDGVERYDTRRRRYRGAARRCGLRDASCSVSLLISFLSAALSSRHTRSQASS